LHLLFRRVGYRIPQFDPLFMEWFMGRSDVTPRQNNRLSAISLANKPPDFHADGAGLYLSVSVTGSRSWILRYMLRGKSRDMGLGPFPGVSLSDARQLAEAARITAAFVVPRSQGNCRRRSGDGTSLAHQSSGVGGQY
jgi:hypothetical protein